MSVGNGKPDNGYPPLSTVLPPLILGTAAFNSQFVRDPFSMPSTAIVSRCLELGVTAFDTSPYYGPSESILGSALSQVANSSTPPLPRSSITLITKVGRIQSSVFDYSASHVRYSVLRSLRRLNTPYLDLVYAHDVEYVSPAEVLEAVRELRRLRDEDRLIRYVGISGFPVSRLVELAELIKQETGEGLDAILSYGNFTIQNRTLGKAELEGTAGHEDQGPARSHLQRLKAAGVDVVLNASLLGMGLLTSPGIPADPETPLADPAADGGEKETSPLAKWHPSPPALRVACQKLAALAAAEGERLEAVAIRWSLAEWARIGALAGVGVKLPGAGQSVTVGASVMGGKSVQELEENVTEWHGVLASIDQPGADGPEAARQRKVKELVEKKLWPSLGDEWLDYAWANPPDNFVNQLDQTKRGVVPDDDGIMAGYEEAKAKAAEHQKVR